MDRLQDVIRQYWGYESLRPLQREAMTAALEHRDSMVVLPTGGGKSLCYQAPSLLSDQLTVVISPLISLMKDQVDSLIQRNVPAAFLNSSLDAEDKRRVIGGIREGRFRMIFCAPERFSGDAFFDMLEQARVGSFAIDEAHCISHWGHDFRNDYRQLGQLKQRFPKASVHAFTATATPRVREDVVQQLGLVDPVVLVGDCFRPNLTYRAMQRQGIESVIKAVVQRRNLPGIVYCIRRVDVDDLTETLRSKGINAAGYHAGMSEQERTSTQDAFATGKTQVIVATVAFGMGIDRKDIRFVIHAAMPKSIEHYQQETGRAGRDGQPAECLLYYSGSDFHTWKSIITKDRGESVQGEEHLRMLSEMYHFCTSMMCRHRKLVTYFGQTWDREGCGACDVCGGEKASHPDSTVIAQKILSCVARVRETFGAGHVADILTGTATDKVIERGHNELTTFGLLRDESKKSVMTWIDQLVDQQLLLRDGEYRILKITPEGWKVLRSQRTATVYAAESSRVPRTRKRRVASSSADVHEQPDDMASSPARGYFGRSASAPGKTSASQPPRPLDQAASRLFESLREVRKQIAEENEVPAFMVLSDRTLREIARARPTSREAMLEVPGVGPAKWDSFGRQFVEAVKQHV